MEGDNDVRLFGKVQDEHRSRLSSQFHAVWSRAFFSQHPARTSLDSRVENNASESEQDDDSEGDEGEEDTSHEDEGTEREKD